MDEKRTTGLRVVNYYYPADVRNMLFAYVNTFCRRAIGVCWGNVFVGVMISDPKPPLSIEIVNNGNDGGSHG